MWEQILGMLAGSGGSGAAGGMASGGGIGGGMSGGGSGLAKLFSGLMGGGGDTYGNAYGGADTKFGPLIFDGTSQVDRPMSTNFTADMLKGLASGGSQSGQQVAKPQQAKDAASGMAGLMSMQQPAGLQKRTPRDVYANAYIQGLMGGL